ncbi:hypothetical protein ANO14919_080730 [Xylariales sp. No.14919]|nr:hypothetical protein ANO14919_080730 [Xylariales sp. No.14919]
MSNNSATSCLSAEPHDEAIKDPLIHYFGCTPFFKRDKLLAADHKIWKDEKEHQTKLESARKTPEAKIGEGVESRVDAIRERWRKDFTKELQRIALIRKTLEEDKADNLVQEVNTCRDKWREYFATKNSKSLPPASDISIAESDASSSDSNADSDTYVPEKDVSVGIIEFEKGEPFSEDYNPSGAKNGLISGKFPDQKTTVQSLLREGKSSDPDQNLLHKDRIRDHPDRIRYFHIPSNNMIWAEEAISRYFGEDRPDFASFQRQLGRQEKTRTSIILQDRYWRGQLHADDRGPSHARYMSPICETILSRREDLKPNNLVLFMPYLHWETSKKREYFASEMDKIMATHFKNKEADEEDERLTRIKERERSHVKNEESKLQQTSTWAKARECVKTGLQTLRTTMYRMHRSQKVDIPGNASSNGESSISRIALDKMKWSPFKTESPLGKYLMAVSKLHEAMANYRDRMLLRKYLPENPPLHPRRTLDQAFYWTLRTTKQRDCDQVVFRGTTAKPEDFHGFDLKAGKWPEEHKTQGPCPKCTASIQKLSRVVMVDQLWMWILDENTIITCFPKRYGANKNDASGIHKSIRSRVEEIGSVHTVFELGLIILDECSKTFFDRTKTLDRRPQAIDEFSKAIGNIMHKQTDAFGQLWWWTEQASYVYGNKGYTDTSHLHMSLLDINPEGQLDREIEDIIEELDIMLHLANTHDEILRKFIEQAENILNPTGEFGPRKGSQGWMWRADTVSQLSKNERAYRCFKQKANEGQARARDYITELQKLRESAKKTAEDVEHLLSMKQQQASVFQAWQAMKQSDETIKQGRSIMTFTLVTIVFLPLSFLSSVFGMNNQEFGNNTWPLSRQILYIFSISAGVVLFSLLFAFSDRTRAYIWSFYTWSSTTLTVKWGIYDFYLERPTKRIEEEAANSAYRVKKKRQEAYFKLRGEKRQEKERLEKERLEKERLEKERLEKERLQKQMLEARETQPPKRGGLLRFGIWATLEKGRTHCPPSRREENGSSV